MTRWPGPAVVYRCFDAEKHLLYVGCVRVGFTEEMLSRVDAFAEEDGRSRPAAIRRLIDEALAARQKEQR